MRWIWPIVVVTLIALPNAAAMVVPFEAWPFTNAPMFAADIARSRLYRPRLVIEGPKERRLSPWRVFRISDRYFTRLLLVSAYGSIDPDTPFGYVENDTPEQFERRLDRFFDVAFARARRQAMPADATSVRLELERVDDGEIHVVGRYDLAHHRFTRAPR